MSVSLSNEAVSWLLLSEMCVEEDIPALRARQSRISNVTHRTSKNTCCTPVTKKGIHVDTDSWYISWNTTTRKLPGACKTSMGIDKLPALPARHVTIIWGVHCDESNQTQNSRSAEGRGEDNQFIEKEKKSYDKNQLNKQKKHTIMHEESVCF